LISAKISKSGFEVFEKFHRIYESFKCENSISHLQVLARFGSALGQDYARCEATHRDVVDTLSEQLWTSAIEGASSQLARRLADISSLTVVEASQRISQWLSTLSASTLFKVEFPPPAEISTVTGISRCRVREDICSVFNNNVETRMAQRAQLGK